jgi:hypothetical protein
MSVLRAWGVSIGMVLCLTAIIFIAMSSAPREAEAGCNTTSVCNRSAGHSSCRTTTSCSPPRVRRCSLVTRCSPQRTCTRRYNTTYCVTRDVCRRVEVCG